MSFSILSGSGKAGRRGEKPRLFFVVWLMILLLSGSLQISHAGQHHDSSLKQRQNEREQAAGFTGRIEYYQSKLDGEKRPYAECATDESGKSLPLIVVVSPGGTNLERTQAITGRYADIIKKNGESAIIIYPTGRGPGSLYMNYGEVDLFEAINDTRSKLSIDPDRISVLGHSMGGAATWYLISHYPDFFSAGNPRSGYCDYRLWEKPGGYTFHMHEWEEPSWKARSAVFLPENFMHTPVWIIHGELDRAIGGGVPVEHSRRMAKLLANNGCVFKYSELKGEGHNFSSAVKGILDESLLWLIRQKKERAPEHVKLATYTLRHNKSYWITIDQLDHYGKRAMVDAEFIEPGRLNIRTENIKTFSLGPVQNRAAVKVRVEGKPFSELDLSRTVTFRRNDADVWERGNFDLSKEKRQGSSGPIADLFYDHTILVVGSTGEDAETTFNRSVAWHHSWRYRTRNGGVHRGGIMGENNVTLPVVLDKDLAEAQLQQNNLILYGTFKSNQIMKRFADRLPVEFDGKVIRVGGRSYAGKDTSVFAVLPHPENPNRYIAVHGGVTVDAITFGSHIDLGLLPDYIVYSGSQVLDWGFWGNDWKYQRD